MKILNKFFNNNFSPVYIILVLLNSCIHNPTEPELNNKISDTAYLIKYFESKGDIINTKLVPPTRDADYVLGYSRNINIIDLRDKEKFSEGRIPNSVNVGPDSIISYVEANIGDSTIVVLVSDAGQLSSYVASVFWMMGYYNVYSLNHGMAAWHEDFGNPVLEEMQDLSFKVLAHLTNDEFNKAEFSPPALKLNLGNLENISEIVAARCREIVNDDFLVNRFVNSEENTYIMCYGNLNLYKAHSREGPTPGKGHPRNAVHYEHALLYHLKSSSHLQTIPSDKKILMYSFSGHLAASTVAYLRVLGYDAYSLKYGGSQLVYDRLVWNQFTRGSVFKTDDIMNFEYITGN